MSPSRQNWQASRYGRRQVVEQPQPVGDFPNRELALAAVPDPYQLGSKPVRVTVNLDTLDRLLQARRIGPGEYAAGRAYQRLLEISMGASALDAGGVRSASADDLVVRVISKAVMVDLELKRIRQLISPRSERLLRATLIELNPNTGQCYTLGDLAITRRHASALAQRLIDALEDMAAHWHKTRLD